VIVEGERAVSEANLGRSIVTDGDGDAIFPNYFGEDLSPYDKECEQRESAAELEDIYKQ